ncbi:hypothetical protein ONZ43_g2191 [Nemania bipapillata]|uniref:Uncharacterized protein n=1 Tax=Nemania bipapillata TaxID=110536 RepID=A0ACC2J1G1_9PEZI|nr:hypothetical protein ONZ43_g2191 [Nemania bipapillata]
MTTVVLEHIDEINSTTRIFRLGIPRGSPPFRFLPGQWLDVYVPGIERAGGFTITSAPHEAQRPHPPLPASELGSESNGGRDDDSNDDDNARGPYIELAVQKSPDNPPAAWLWRDPVQAPVPVLVPVPVPVPAPAPAQLIGAALRVRVGGGFVWPPPGVNVRALRRVVFVAGGLGVNPLVAMLSSLASRSPAPPPPPPPPPSTATATAAGGGFEVHFLYSLRDPMAARRGARRRNRGKRDGREMLFLERIARVFREGRVRGRLEVFLTAGGDGDGGDGDGGDGDGGDGDGGVDGEGKGEGEKECDGKGEKGEKGEGGRGKGGWIANLDEPIPIVLSALLML